VSSGPVYSKGVDISCNPPQEISYPLPKARLTALAILPVVFALLGLFLLVDAVTAGESKRGNDSVSLPDIEPISAIPLKVDVNWDKVALGEKLFNDPRLSHDGFLACASCHQLDQGGDDGLPLSITNTGEPGVINAPTVFNSAFNFRLTWRGRFRTLDDQVEAVLHNPMEMNTNWTEILPKLQADADYTVLFSRLYLDGIKGKNVLDAISNFQRSLITPNARFDQYLRGRRDALTEDEKQGYQLFRTYGCAACHQGVNVGGNLYQKLGIFMDYFAGRGKVTEADFGRFLETGADSDRYVFRVPSLRNVAVTAPYFHDGSVSDLEEAVQKMGEVQLGETLAKAEISLIVKFLRSLTGEYRGRSLDME